MFIEASLVQEQPQFIIAHWNRLVSKTYWVFFHKRTLYAARVELDYKNDRVARKFARKYDEFNGSTSDFLALNKHNFVIDHWDISKIIINQEKNKKTGFIKNDGTIEFHNKNGSKNEFVLFWNDIDALEAMLKKEITKQVTILNRPTEEETITEDKNEDVLLPTQDKSLVSGNERATNNAYIEEISPQDQVEIVQDANIPLAILFGLVAAIVATGLWFIVVLLTGYQLGLVAIAIGWLVAQAVVRGAGNRQGTVLQVISVLITVFAMFSSEYFIIRHFAVMELAKEGITGVPLLFPIADIVEIIISSIQESPQTLFFWAIAVIEAYKIPAQHHPEQTRSLEES